MTPKSKAASKNRSLRYFKEQNILLRASTSENAANPSGYLEVYKVDEASFDKTKLAQLFDADFLNVDTLKISDFEFNQEGYLFVLNATNVITKYGFSEISQYHLPTNETLFKLDVLDDEVVVSGSKYIYEVS